MRKSFFVLIVIAFSFLLAPLVLAFSPLAESPSYYLSPSQGNFLVDSTFSVSIYLNTKNLKINAVELDLKFSPEILQVTSPTAGESFISQWLTPPSYSNEGGTVSFKGGIPEGIVTSAGLVSTITFRARSSGLAKIEFLDSSRVLLADGKGTSVPSVNINGLYEIVFPPPEGPRIFSSSHPDPGIWYMDSGPAFSWEEEERVVGFSYSFSQNPREVPDTLPEENATFKAYEKVADGIWYFHLRQNKNGVWGKTSHFQVKIDTTPPEKIDIKAEAHTGFVHFEARDVHSGIDRYEISVVNLDQFPTPTSFFVEAVSPYKIPYQEPGKYKVTVRVFDKAGNFQAAEAEFHKLSPFISLIKGKGLQIKGFFIAWPVFFISLFLILAFSGFLLFRFFEAKSGFKKGIKEIEEALAEIKKIEQKEKSMEEKKKLFEKQKEKLEEELKQSET